MAYEGPVTRNEGGGVGTTNYYVVVRLSSKCDSVV
jgi:hypothetical protein